MPPTQQENLKKFAELWKMMSESLTRAEFERAFKVVIEFVQKIHAKNEEEMKMMKSMHEEMMKEMQGGNSEMIEEAMREMKKKMMEMCEPMLKKMYSEHEEMMKGMMSDMKDMKSDHSKMMKDHTEEMNFIYDKVRTMKSGEDGKDADEEKIIKEVLANIPEPDKTEFEKLKEKVENEIERIKQILSNLPRGRGMGRAKSQVIRRINLTSQVDGATSAFTLDPDVVDVLGVFGTQFPVNFNAGTDWTFAGRTLTLVTAQVGIPQAGQTLWVLADVLFYP